MTLRLGRYATVQLEYDPCLWALPFGVVLDLEFVSVGFLCWWFAAWWGSPAMPAEALVPLTPANPRSRCPDPSVN